MKKILIAVVLLLCLSSFAGTAGADIKVKSVNSVPDPYSAVNYFNVPTDSHTVNQAVYEVAYLDNALPIFSSEEFNVVVDSQSPFFGGFFQGYYQDGTAYIFTIQNDWFTKRIPAVVAHELGHAVRFKFMTTDQLNQYIAQRGVTKDQITTFDAEFPGTIAQEEIWAEDFRQLFGGPDAQVTLYSDNIPPPTEQDREWILDHITPMPPKH